MYRLTDIERATVCLDRFSGRSTGHARVETRLRERGWHEYDGRMVRRFARDNALVKHESSGRVRFHRGSDWIDRPFGDLHPVTISELLRDLDEATASKRRAT